MHNVVYHLKFHLRKCLIVPNRNSVPIKHSLPPHPPVLGTSALLSVSSVRLVHAPGELGSHRVPDRARVACGPQGSPGLQLMSEPPSLGGWTVSCDVDGLHSLLCLSPDRCWDSFCLSLV